MNFDLSKPTDLTNFSKRSKELIRKGSLIELKEVKKTRTNKQNSALHKYFVLIAIELNELGNTFTYTGLKGKEIQVRYTPDIVKNFMWRPIQMALFDIESTTKLTTAQMNEIILVIDGFFAERGVTVDFPSID